MHGNQRCCATLPGALPLGPAYEDFRAASGFGHDGPGRRLMRWDQFRRSDNIEDRRDDSSSGGFGMPVRTGGLGIGTILVLGLIGWALGIDPRILIGGAEILSGGGCDQPQYQEPTRTRQSGTP